MQDLKATPLRFLFSRRDYASGRGLESDLIQFLLAGWSQKSGGGVRLVHMGGVGADPAPPPGHLVLQYREDSIKNQDLRTVVFSLSKNWFFYMT